MFDYEKEIAEHCIENVKKHKFDISLHAVVRYCSRVLNVKINEREIHQNSKGFHTDNFDHIVNAYDHINFIAENNQLKNTRNKNQKLIDDSEGIKLAIRDGNFITTVMTY